MNLLPFLACVVGRYPDTPVMAACGIAGGRSLAALLAAGADGAWMGTDFLSTLEAEEVPGAFKEQIARSDGQDTTFTRLYDLIGAGPWPRGVGGRVYNNRFVQMWDGCEAEVLFRREELA